MKEKILHRVQEHYNYLQSLGYEVVCTILQGSQNYGLDEYSEEYMSDVDTKSIVLPSMKDFIRATPPKSEVIVLPNNEHAEIKDIRVMFEMFKKMNLSYIELLFSEFIIINPAWEQLILPLWRHRARIAAFNKNQFVRCIYGMAMEKRKALCHPYPNIIEKIEKYGFDGKQLHHCARLAEFIDRYRNGEPLEDCYKSKRREDLMMLKKQRDAGGMLLSAEEAIKMCDGLVSAINNIKNEMLTEKDVIDEEAIVILEEIKYNILKEKMRRELNDNSL